MKIPYVEVDYKEFHPETYNGIKVTITDENGELNESRINSGDFNKDWEHVTLEYTPFYKSSSVDNFIADLARVCE